ncbi:MAG: hypothetical protein GOVbin1573_27 [Prokaryotic dsDNA virus sp.]|nr:MAG: hypothetical protein GOVbin1573_27 [Prokaryotic dsDNA virus sp.]|tara:strand:- start:1718 stop:2074 length:357 start_codon:yes stop_codon:yes gene_type:complete
MKAEVVPYSSIVGQIISLIGDDGAVIGSLRAISQSGGDMAKDDQALARAIAAAINTPAQAAGLAAGTHVVVPVEAVDPWHIWCFLRGRGAKCEKFRDEFEDDGLGEDLRAWAAAQKEG